MVTWAQAMGPAIAAILIIAGIIYLLFGYYLYKFLIVLNFALLAAIGGAAVGSRWHAPEIGAVVAALTAGALAWPLMKYAVAIIGGVYGAMLGAALWQGAGLHMDFAWSGATMGLILFGLLSFLLFRGCIILYTALQGSFMFVFGVLGLVCKYPDLADSIARYVTLKPMLVPIAVFVPMVIGLLFQQSNFPAAQPGKK
jgi:hypothetical protein